MQNTRKNKLYQDERYLRPQAANDLMKAARIVKQTVYLFGATGFGKTSFVADYLSRRRYEYYSAHDISLPETNIICDEKSDTERIVVIDDLHQVVTASDRRKCCDVISKLAESRNVWLILVSRSPVPAWLKTTHIEHVFALIGERDLSFSPAEEAQYFEKWDLYPSDDAERNYRSLYGARPLFLKIAAMRLRDIPADLKSGAEYIKEETAALKRAEKDFTDYLNANIYDFWDMDLQEFLTDISIVDQFDLRMAKMVTRKTDAKELILLSQEIGNFMSERTDGDNSVYEIRYPIKLSLRSRLEKLRPQPYIDNLYYSAGSCYELQGKFPEALYMYKKCRNDEAVSRLLIENTRKHPGNGYYLEFRKYYLSLSEEMVKQSPELMAGLSLLHSIMMNDEESERWYQELSEYMKCHTGSKKKTAQLRLLYLDITLSQRDSGQMVDILKRAWAFTSTRKVVLPELSVTNNQPSTINGGKDFFAWTKYDRGLYKSIGKLVENLLGSFGKGLPDLALAESLFEKGGDNYEIASLLQKGRLQALSNGKEELVFVSTGLLAWLSVFNNHMDDALESLYSFRSSAAYESPQLLSGIDTLKTHFLLYGGRTADVDEWMKQAPDELAEFCTLERYRYITKVRVYLSTGKREKARNLLLQLQIYAEVRKRLYLQIETKVLLSITQFRLGASNWKETLQAAISQAGEYHLVRILSREGAALWELLKSEKFVWNDESFKKQVMSECEQMAQLYPAYLSEKKYGSVLLSDKALKVLRLQAEGLNTEQIASELNLSKAGVKYYNQETYKKLGVNSKAAAITEARNLKMI